MAINEQSDKSTTVLDGYRVIDLTSHLSQMCARTLGDLGADVIKVEPPGGDPSRTMGPFAEDIPGPERSLSFINANRSKRSIVLDFASSDKDRGILINLIKQADILVEDFQPEYLSSLGLGYETIHQINPTLIYVSITPFGQSGPKASWLGSELIAAAAGGIMYANGDDNAPPCMAPYQLLSQFSSIHGAFGALLAIRARESLGGDGQHVDVSRQEVVLWLENSYISRYQYQDMITRREGARTAFGAVNTYHTLDDAYVNISVYSDEHFGRLARNVLDHPILSDPLWQKREVRTENREIIDSFIQEYAIQVERDELVEKGQKGGIPIVPLLKMEEFVHHPHVKHRGFIIEEDHPVIGKFKRPGSPVIYSKSKWNGSKPAPTIGQHTEEILEELKLNEAKRKSKVATSSSKSIDSPLVGTRVIDLTRAHAGFICGMYLGFFGAEVIRIDSDGLENPRTPGTNYSDMNRNKLSCTIDVRTKEGKEVFFQLVKESDVVVEHFRPGVMEKLGISYEDLIQHNENIILLSMPGMGSSGPIHEYRSYGQQVMGMTGLTHLWGSESSPLDTRIKMPFPDYVAAVLGAMSVVGALEFRERTGSGQLIELAQLEAMAHFLGPGIIDYTVNDRPPKPQGNNSDYAAPHDVYTCVGFDAWCAVSVHNEEEWANLKEAIGSPSWAEQEEFSSIQNRVNNKIILDQNLSEWTKQFTAQTAARILQKGGVPASAVMTAEDLYHDIHLRSRKEGIVQVDHPDYGITEHQGLNIHMSETPGTSTLPSPAMGQHNQYVFEKILNLTKKEVSELREKGALI